MSNNNNCDIAYGRHYRGNQLGDNYYRYRDHNHEFLSSTNYEEDENCEEHNHRIAGTTGPAIRVGLSHVHRIEEVTDTFNDHNHRVCITTGPAIYISRNKHIHIVQGQTSFNDGHDHDYFFTTLIDDPSNVPDRN
ncbi:MULTISPECIES: YmaF family protein [Clostridium]|jgi:hypothetical protein|uniref:YmaF family protein n=3 Tax=Clostridium TaxID=1485 RepID=A0A0B5QCH3_CLOBE|nr:MULTISPECIES: YmaF family protein [Clostridium]ABR34053.1 hypothetical protein Cbei_1882 [Clostridium beijerinckii NCIMB 8052]AIU01006.1 hypothetical protein Cbs_1882 [Clostridium beijerinckii ATCC 35702]AJG98640.1 hypothetical protein LF65_02042 [Clostridium beijerinckii]ALB46894.1 hypothetical protein X276_17445 [Clostridium beijerinckii NRRL B-598]AQS04525.1 YmaF family protein [Clostridium beijerinckii]